MGNQEVAFCRQKRQGAFVVGNGNQAAQELLVARKELYASLKRPCPVNHWKMCRIECRRDSDEQGLSLVLTKAKGKLWSRMGYTKESQRHLHAEEALFLATMCSAQIMDDGCPLGLCRIFQMLIGDDEQMWNRHIVYGHLRRAGYTVVRFRLLENDGRPVPETPCQGSTRSAVAEWLAGKPVYDVHNTSHGFSFKRYTKPDRRVVIFSADDSLPSVDTIQTVQESLANDQCPLFAACVDGSSVLFYRLQPVHAVQPTL